MIKNDRQTRSKNNVSHLSTSTLNKKTKTQSKKLGVYQEQLNTATIPNPNQSEIISDTLKYLNSVARRIKSRSSQDHTDKNPPNKSTIASNKNNPNSQFSENSFESLANFGIYNKTREVTQHHVTKLRQNEEATNKIIELKHQSPLNDKPLTKVQTLQIKPDVVFDSKDTSNLRPIFKLVIGNQGKVDLSPIIVWMFENEYVTSSFAPNNVQNDLLSHLKNIKLAETPLMIKQIVNLRNFYSLPEEVYIANFRGHLEDLLLTEELLLEALDYLDLYNLKD